MTLIHARADAIRTKDVNALIRCFEVDATYYTLVPPLMAGAEIKQVFGDWFSSFCGPIGIEMRDINILADDKIACCYYLCRIHGTKVTGEKPDLWFRETLCLRNNGGMWMIAHSHESVPFYRDGSLRAALDLEP